ncbi:hypothetical protein Nepgr_032270 [Nepenthes gracilis]|uniref:Uncharacterized protein n=1 Tax=Nepenthes gracilis TaxID=150966 RepID=A0AAD3TJ53_NEPGR|nr:hypothetical protein Nepgr_032270 [Nepenthes gracilis]
MLSSLMLPHPLITLGWMWALKLWMILLQIILAADTNSGMRPNWAGSMEAPQTSTLNWVLIRIISTSSCPLSATRIWAPEDSGGRSSATLYLGEWFSPCFALIPVQTGA